MEKTNRNVFLNVDLKNPAEPIKEEEVVEMPEEPKVEPEEEKIFKKKDLVLEKPADDRKKDRKTNQKREVTPKMKAHLERIRKLAQESKAKKKAEKEGKQPAPRAPTPTVPMPSQPHLPSQPIAVPQRTQPSVESVGGSIDYDRIINGLWNKQQQQTQLQSQITQAREQIRREEREKALKESTSLFTQAYQAHQKKQQQNVGLQALRGFTPQHSHPVFKNKQNPLGTPQQSNNPFDVCFK